MSLIPNELRYTKEHEWVAATDRAGIFRIGITDFAQSALGDIVYIQMPKPGEEVIADKICGEVESTKSVSKSMRRSLAKLRLSMIHLIKIQK